MSSPEEFPTSARTVTHAGTRGVVGGPPHRFAPPRVVTAVAIALALLVGLPGVASAEASGQQSFVLVFTADPTQTPGKVIARGPITGVGSVRVTERSDAGLSSIYEFAAGTLSVTATPIGGSFEPDFRSCTARGTSVSHVEVTGGTGDFARATGNGLATGTTLPTGARGHDGECLLGQQPPARGIEIVDVEKSLVIGSP